MNNWKWYLSTRNQVISPPHFFLKKFKAFLLQLESGCEEKHKVFLPTVIDDSCLKLYKGKKRMLM